jgi:uncharacterized membrane protein YciS (DUF1049 family)
MEAFYGIAGLIIIIFLIVLAIVWIILPFMVSGINTRLDKLNANIVRIGKLLNEQSKPEGSDETVHP